MTVTAGPDAWAIARDYLAVGAPILVAPPGDDPAGYDWQLLRGHPPVLLRLCGDLGSAEVGRLAAAILHDAGGRVLVLPSGRLFCAGGAADA